MTHELKSVTEVECAIRDMDRLRMELKATKAALDEYKQAVIAYMKAHQMSTFSTMNGYSATLYEGKRKRFDVTKFAVDHPHTYEQYLVDEERNQLYFKVR